MEQRYFKLLTNGVYTGVKKGDVYQLSKFEENGLARLITPMDISTGTLPFSVGDEAEEVFNYNPINDPYNEFNKHKEALLRSANSQNKPSEEVADLVFSSKTHIDNYDAVINDSLDSKGERWTEEEEINTMIDTASKYGKRVFSSGASRNQDKDKLDFEGFLSPLALKRYAEYMHKNRKLEDGSLRDSDNWQRGIPKDQYIKSLWRHFFDTWSNHRGLETKEDQQMNLCGVIFNSMGMLHELLKEENEKATGNI